MTSWGKDMEQQLPKRKHPRLRGYDYSLPGAYFITVCTKERRNYFWSNVGACIARPQDVQLSTLGKIVDEAIQGIAQIYSSLEVEQYVVMPDHIHLLIRICADEYGRPMVAPTMARVVQQLKGYTTKKMGVTIWQKSFYDHIIRSREDYEEHRRYIYENPMTWVHDELYTEK